MPGNRLRGVTYHIVGDHAGIRVVMDAEGARRRGLETADLVIFTGGTDINPKLYKEYPHHMTSTPDEKRDRMECAVYHALDKKQWKVGICRGAQLLNVLNGGKLWQHVEGHKYPHEALYTNEKGVQRGYMVSSTHHQMMMTKSAKAQVWCVANQTQRRELSDGKSFDMSKNHWADPEVVYYPETMSLCFQPHPEYFSPKDTRELFYICLNRMIEA
jgi:carbamoylphosphate synthase small subunit